MRIIDIPNDMIGEANDKIYNGALFEHDRDLWLCYRFEPYKTFNTELGVIKLDSGLTPIMDSKKHLKIPRYNSNCITLDDPRIIQFQNQTVIFHAQGALTPKGNWSNCTVAAFVNSDFNCMQTLLPDYGKNKNFSSTGHKYDCEKNWVPFSNGSSLRVIYTIDPLEIMELEFSQHREFLGTKLFSKTKSDLGWKYGWPSGGTVLLRKGKEFWGIFHSHLPCDNNIRDYYMGFFAISAEAPHRVTRISTEPIMKAEMNLAEDLRGESKKGWAPNVVFPLGLIERNNMVYVSYGWQDCRVKIMETTWNELMEGVKEVKEIL